MEDAELCVPYTRRRLRPASGGPVWAPPVSPEDKVAIMVIKITITVEKP